jgi:hypothetical protein
MGNRFNKAIPHKYAHLNPADTLGDTLGDTLERRHLWS